MKTWIIALLCLLLLPWMVEAGEYYRWVDENGVSHITDQPPPSQGNKVKIYRTPQSVNQTTPQAEASGQSTQNEEVGSSNSEDAQRRAKYEEELRNEESYRANYKSSYGNAPAREYWRGKLENLEKMKQSMENSGSNSEPGGESPSESEATPADQTPR